MLTPDPINTGQLRVIANILDGQQLKPWAAIIGAAADEIDRLRREVEIERLRAAVPPEYLVLVCHEPDDEFNMDVHVFAEVHAAHDFFFWLDGADIYCVRSWTRHERGEGGS